jgi:hypothetical protein
MYDKACVMSELLRYAKEIPDIRLIGRPALKDGKRIAKKYGWVPLNSERGIPLEIWEGRKPSD